MNGALLVDKPAGPTSHDVVARIRRAAGEKRIGHTGTLDPLATGVLPLLLGRATRLAQFVVADEKAYVAGIRLGLATATYDAEERVIRGEGSGPPVLQPLTCTVAVTREQVEEALRGFVGTFEQVPPPFSAKKLGGTPAYRLARRQEPALPRAVQVTVTHLMLADYRDGLATVEIVSSSGFYVRSLAHDLGLRLGCGAHLESLRRVRAGAFRVEAAVPLSVLESTPEAVRTHLMPMAALLPDIPAVRVTARGAARIAHGQGLGAGDLAGGSVHPSDGLHVRILAGDDLVAIARRTPAGTLQPVAVLV